MTKRSGFLLIMFLCSAGVYAQQPAPTWSSDVACIIYSHCSSCHNPTGIAPFSLMNYNDAYIQAAGIKYYVSARVMPPYLPNVSYQHYADMKTLTTQEINTLVAWVDSGTPVGDTAQQLPPPTFIAGPVLTHPDITARIPNYTVPNTGSDLYRCFILTTPLDSFKYVKSIEVIPGNTAAVHHVVVFADTSNLVLALDSADPGPGYTDFADIGTNTAIALAAWAPGTGVETMPDSMGIPLVPGTRIVIQIHYPIAAVGLLDSTRVNIQYTSNDNVRTVYVAPLLNNNLNMTDGPIYIPLDSVRTYHEADTLGFDMTLLAIAPHAHYVCTNMLSYAVTPANDTIPLIEIDHWDFHWQGPHFFQKPIKIPAGSIIYGKAFYENNYNNTEVPLPLRNIPMGFASTDEMMVFYCWFLPYQQGDEDVIIDTASHLPHYMGCVSPYVTDTSATDTTAHINTGIVAAGHGISSIYPSPAQNILYYQSDAALTSLTVVDIEGHIVKRFSTSDSVGQIPVGSLSSGFYFIRMQEQSGAVQVLRFVKN